MGTLDGTAAIKAAAGEAPPSGISDGLDQELNELGDLTQKLLDAVEAKIDATMSVCVSTHVSEKRLNAPPRRHDAQIRRAAMDGSGGTNCMQRRPP